MRNIFLILLILLTLLLFSCQHAGLLRGCAEDCYTSSARPNITLAAPGLPLKGCAQKNVSLPDAGMVGGLHCDAWITVYGHNPMVVFGLADLPPGWIWDANLHHSFAKDEEWITLGGISFYAQTFLERQGKNPFVEENEQAASWLIRNFSARCNGDRTKLVLEYREKAPIPLSTLASMPYGHATLLKDFAKRATAAISVTQGHLNAPTTRAIPTLHTHLLTEHFWGTASVADYWRDR